MKRLQCPSCGAPLPKTAPADGRLVCEYCGAEYQSDPTGRQRVVRVDLSSQAPQIGAAVSTAGRWVIGVIAAVFALALGLRQGEALGLQWDDVDWTRSVLTIKRSRTRPRYEHRCQPHCGHKYAGGESARPAALVEPKQYER